jgi:outer membrane protein OmpA-like peptidoglycan-associated protein
LKSVFLVAALALLAFASTGCQKAPPITLSAAAAPPVVYAGDPVTVTATAGAVDPNKKNVVVYDWSGTGVTGTGTTATVATAALTPGTYSVKAEVKEGKKGKEGLKPGQTADATASFTVKQFEPPTVSVSASPSTIKPGETSNITAAGVSPQNRPLTYVFSATGGSVTSSGAAAVFASTGAPTGTVNVTVTVTDDKAQTATASTSVTILAPYVAPIPHVQQLGTIDFSKDKKNPTRANNEAKASLDGIALQLQQNPDAKLVVVGEADSKEQAKTAKEVEFALKHKHAKVVDLAAERAVNVKDYLVTEKGIDASRISVVTDTKDSQAVETYLVPSGATFTNDVTGTTVVDESAVKPHPFKAIKRAVKKVVKKVT